MKGGVFFKEKDGGFAPKREAVLKVYKYKTPLSSNFSQNKTLEFILGLKTRGELQ
ncbi:hypothetical protein [Olleya sp. HaHaR_3_96]|uniref:hypothetical protein n=1 Tax=Olleya sp. HaHaR_3_96 TaxID=2745560 RepID=UPI001C4FC3A3|nr:hypothetical protein [Olleya sp. HaHaR_3_96]QXP58703.1 hypothetical protein H0I26_12355 [Olleya sp. HaHaR_3_96]